MIFATPASLANWMASLPTWVPAPMMTIEPDAGSEPPLLFSFVSTVGSGRPKPEVGWKRAMNEVTALTGRVTSWSSVSDAGTAPVAGRSRAAYCCKPASSGTGLLTPAKPKMCESTGYRWGVLGP